MRQPVELSGLDEAIAGLDARLTALAAAVLRAAGDEVGADARHRFGGDAEVDVTAAPESVEVRVMGRTPVDREFGTLGRPAQPWLQSALDRAADKVVQGSR